MEQDGKLERKKNQKKVEKLISPSEGAGVFSDTVVGTAADAFVHRGIPWLAKKSVEMGGYGTSELMRNKNLQKKAVNYGINKLTPFIQDSVGSTLDQLSTKVRSNIKYKTGRAELNGRGIDIHRWIGKLPRLKAGWTPGIYKYTGAYNPLDEQLKYEPNSGEVQEWYVDLYSKVDEISAHHDICYDRGVNKHQCDKEMIERLEKFLMVKCGVKLRDS